MRGTDAALSIAACLLAAACASGGEADAVYTNGTIYTVDDAQPFAEAVAIKDGEFLVVGTNADVEAVTGPGTEVVDLDGRFAMPGIFDLHVHPFATPLFNAINLDFSEPTNVDVMLRELREFAEANPDKEWIRAGSWSVGVFPNNSPRKELLDEIIPDRPVVAIDNTGHAYWVNSRALELAGINAETETNTLYLIDKDPATGEPTGTVRESSLRLIERVAEQPTDAEYSQAFLDVFREFHSGGVTSMQTAEGNSRVLDVVKAMDDNGELTMRLFVSWDWHLHQTTPYTNDEMDQQIADRSQYASDMIAPNFVKIFTDGTPDGYAVPFVEPYGDGSGNYGSGKLTPGELRDVVVAFDAMGVGTFMHAIGDGSVRAALDAVEAARQINGNTGVRHKLSHVTWIHPDDIPRFGEIPDLAVDISPAATYPTTAMVSFVPLVGEERYRQVYRAGSLLRAGARLGWGTDWLTMIPPAPWMPMQGFVTRTNPDAPEMGVLGVNEELTVEEAIRVFTINGAYAVGADDRLGSIQEGKQADMIVLDRNLLEIDPTDIRNTRVMTTMVHGRVVFER